METAIIIAWRTSIMPVPAYATYHKHCYTGTMLPVIERREVPVADVAGSAICCECWGLIRKDAEDADITNAVA